MSLDKRVRKGHLAVSFTLLASAVGIASCATSFVERRTFSAPHGLYAIASEPQKQRSRSDYTDSLPEELLQKPFVGIQHPVIRCVEGNVSLRQSFLIADTYPCSVLPTFQGNGVEYEI